MDCPAPCASASHSVPRQPWPRPRSGCRSCTRSCHFAAREALWRPERSFFSGLACGGAGTGSGPGPSLSSPVFSEPFGGATRGDTACVAAQNLAGAVWCYQPKGIPPSSSYTHFSSQEHTSGLVLALAGLGAALYSPRRENPVPTALKSNGFGNKKPEVNLFGTSTPLWISALKKTARSRSLHYSLSFGILSCREGFLSLFILDSEGGKRSKIQAQMKRKEFLSLFILDSERKQLSSSQSVMKRRAI
ncbi:uncharacterized protein LOC134476164 isoform X2 [Cavia porcellus]|uniref:uncharacterized protein LOC134476164 isoform X2 n=1 Tax=Cavia porcellus TaxID=10141 RepID=UPI002FE21D70